MSFFLRFNASCLNRVDCALPEIIKKKCCFRAFCGFYLAVEEINIGCIYQLY